MSKRKLLTRLMRDESAMSTVEYGLICGLIVLTMITALSGFADAVRSTWTDIATQTENSVAKSTAS